MLRLFCLMLVVLTRGLEANGMTTLPPAGVFASLVNLVVM